MNAFDLSGEVAAVIGGTGVLGGAIARGLAGHGARVAVLGRSEERGNERVREIAEAGGTAAFFPCDATDAASLQAAHAALEQRLGMVDVLVNAAGGNQAQVTVTDGLSFEDIALGDWRAEFERAIVNIGNSIVAKSTTSASWPFSRATSANRSANSRLVPDVAVIIRKFAMKRREALHTSTE